MIVMASALASCKVTQTTNVWQCPTCPEVDSTVTPPPPPPVNTAATIRLSPDSTGITMPATYTFAGVATGKDGKATTITWSTLSPSIATVDPKTGLVTGVNPGMARIVGTNDADPTVKDTVKIMVTQQVQSVSMTAALPMPTTLTVSNNVYLGKVGTSAYFDVTVLPSTYTFTCKSDMGSVVTFTLVTVNGKKQCLANFIAPSPQNGVSPVQVYAVTDQAHTFPNGTSAQLQAGVQIRVTATGK